MAVARQVLDTHPADLGGSDRQQPAACMEARDTRRGGPPVPVPASGPVAATALVSDVLGRLARGELHSPEPTRLPLDRAAEALARLGERDVRRHSTPAP